MTIQTRYDPEADALDIRISDARPVQGADAGPLTLHYDAEGKVVSIEVLGASTVLANGLWSKAPAKSAPSVVAAE